MAIVRLQRAHYRPKMPVIHYVVDQRILVRSRPARVRNPRTAAQQANRTKLRAASRFLAPLRAFAARGFNPSASPNGRAVGAYHVALGHLLNHGMKREGGEWRIDYPHVELSEGSSLAPYPLRIHRQGRVLTLEWESGLPAGARRVRLAFHHEKTGKTALLLLDAPQRGAAAELTLPKWAKSGELHLWWGPEGEGQARWASRYIPIPRAVTLVVGWVVAHVPLWSISLPLRRDINRSPHGIHQAPIRD